MIQPVLGIILKYSGIIAASFILSIAANMGQARSVWVENGEGNAFLFEHRGNCYVILPTHVHGRSDVQLSAREPAGIGTARIIHEVAGADLSLGVATGSITQDCGPRWRDLPDRLALRAGAAATVVRYQQGSIETIPGTLATVTFGEFEVSAADSSDRFFAARTSGAIVYAGDTPIGMIVQADERSRARALRMDEIRNQLARVVEDWYDQNGCADAEGCAPPPDPAPATLSGFALTSWSPHGIAAEAEAERMIAGDGPYIARDLPVVLMLEAPEILPISRIVMTSLADEAESFTPKLVKVEIDTSSDGINRWRPFRSPKDMVPGAALDLRRGETSARRVKVTIHSSWGGTPVRIDSLAIE